MSKHVHSWLVKIDSSSLIRFSSQIHFFLVKVPILFPKLEYFFTKIEILYEYVQKESIFWIVVISLLLMIYSINMVIPLMIWWSICQYFLTTLKGCCFASNGYGLYISILVPDSPKKGPQGLRFVVWSVAKKHGSLLKGSLFLLVKSWCWLVISPF